MGSGTRAAPRTSPLLKRVRPPELRFRDTAREWGVLAPNLYGGERTKKFILEMTGNGVAIVDYDNDGLPDVVLLNGARLDGQTRPSVVYRNLGGGKFVDRTAASGLATSGWVQGACAGDVDNNGYIDLLITKYGAPQLWLNERGRFRLAPPVPVGGEEFFTGCTLTDYDRDGRLDMFLTTYVEFSLRQAVSASAPAPCNWKGLNVFCGPRGAGGGKTYLFHNEGGGRFRDVSESSGIRVTGKHYGLGAVAADLDDDGWPDIYVACDSTPSLLFHNQRDGTFQEIAVAAGVAYGENGQEQGGMGVAVFDSNNDGRLDIVRTNFIDETTSLYRNQGEMFFVDDTVAGGLGLNTKNVSWGVRSVDFDQDGHPDVAIANGHIYPELGAEFPQPRSIYWNAGNGAFAEVPAGEAILAPRVSRGMASGDLDGDGAPELVIVNQNRAPMILRNETPDRGNWLLLQLEGTRSNRSAIGAKVTVNGVQTAEVQSGGSYLSHSDLRLHFGMGAATKVERIDIRWPSGTRQTIGGVAVNQVLKIIESSR